MTKHKVVSLFSGAGGLDIGLEATGRFVVVAAVDSDPAACETLRLNRDAGRTACQEMRVYEMDIKALEPERVMEDLGLAPGELDLLAGAPPCQTFSSAGKRGSVQDTRGTLIWDFLRFVEVMRPKFFLMENVRPLLSAAVRHRPLAQRPERGGPPLAEDERPGSVLRLFLADVPEEYRVDIFEVNAVNYGAPQLRERVFFVGNRFNALVDLPEPTHLAPEACEALARSGSLFAGACRPWRTLGEALAGLREESPEVMDFSPRKKRYLEMVPPGGNWRSLPEEVAKESMGRAFYAKGGRSGWWRRLSLDLPCPTLVTMPNHASTSLCHPLETRALSVREYARIQEFPDEWAFAGRTADKYRLIGNAVPVRLARVVGEAVARALDEVVARGFAPWPQKRPRFRRVYLQSHVRTRRWFDDGEVYMWKDGEENGKARYGVPKTGRKETTLDKEVEQVAKALGNARHRRTLTIETDTGSSRLNTWA